MLVAVLAAVRPRLGGLVISRKDRAKSLPAYVDIGACALANRSRGVGSAAAPG